MEIILWYMLIGLILFHNKWYKKDRLVRNLSFLCYNFNDFKKKIIKINENNTNVNWLARIYAVHHLNHYKMIVCEKWDLTSFNKKVRKIIKYRLKYTRFWEEL